MESGDCPPKYLEGRRSDKPSREVSDKRGTILRRRTILLDAAAISILVDDKASPIPDRARWVREIGKLHSTLFSKVDFVCFESGLEALLPAMLSLLRSSGGERVATRVSDYRLRKGALSCSQDIALWHAMRLGFFPGCESQILSLGRKELGAFFSPNIASFLDERHRSEEIRADRILRTAGIPQGDQQIMRIYEEKD